MADLPSTPRRPRHSGRRPLGWALTAVRTRPVLLLVLIPAVLVTLAMAMAALIMWAVLVTVALVLGRGSGRRCRSGRPRHHVHAARRRPGSSWI